MPVTHEVASSSLVVPELNSGGFSYRYLILNDRARSCNCASCASEPKPERFCLWHTCHKRQNVECCRWRASKTRASSFPPLKRESARTLFLMAGLIVVRIAFASSADFGKAEVNDSERNAVPVCKL